MSICVSLSLLLEFQKSRNCRNYSTQEFICVIPEMDKFAFTWQFNTSHHVHLLNWIVTMPEYHECLAHFLFILWLWQKLQNDHSWALVGTVDGVQAWFLIPIWYQQWPANHSWQLATPGFYKWAFLTVRWTWTKSVCIVIKEWLENENSATLKHGAPTKWEECYYKTKHIQTERQKEMAIKSYNSHR